MDERGRQHPPHQQMERRELHRQAGLPCHDVYQVQPGEGPPVPLRNEPRQRPAGRPVQREPHTGGGEQRGQNQRGDKEPERAFAERSDRPKGRPPATAAGEAEKEEQQRHENVIPCPPLNPK